MIYFWNLVVRSSRKHGMMGNNVYEVFRQTHCHIAETRQYQNHTSNTSCSRLLFTINNECQKVSYFSGAGHAHAVLILTRNLEKHNQKKQNREALQRFIM